MTMKHSFLKLPAADSCKAFFGCDRHAPSIFDFRNHLEKARPEMAVARVHRSRRGGDGRFREQPSRRKIQIQSGTLPALSFRAVCLGPEIRDAIARPGQGLGVAAEIRRCGINRRLSRGSRSDRAA